MAEPAQQLGCLCIVLHGHLPYVLNHGSWPHGEAWLFEAAAETYLPLLRVLDEVAGEGGRSALTVGLTPILLEQLRAERFRTGLIEYLEERAERAGTDRRAFERATDREMAGLAGRWEGFYRDAREQFESLGRDIVGRFGEHLRARQIQVLTSAATHPYLPLLLTDESLRAQIAAGTAATREHLGTTARGMWLPECAYRPAFESWRPPVVYGDQERPRAGLERWMAAAGIDHFFVDAHMFENGDPLAYRPQQGGAWRPADPFRLHLDAERGWRQQLSPVGVVSELRPPEVFAFARHPLVSEQVWSATVGYPGSPEYLDFHRRHGERGLRYHKVTDHLGDLGSKRPYVPGEVPGKLREQAEHFVGVVRRILQHYRAYTGRAGVVVAPFDAELFGHWWFEGPRFLHEVVKILSRRTDVCLLTAEEALDRFGCDKAMRLPDASWGKYGNNSTWFNDKSQWMWEIEYRAEDRLLKLLKELPWREKPEVRSALEHAARQLLLMQASDWPFVIHSQGAVDYGIQRFAGHATAFNRATAIAEHVASAKQLTEVQRVELADMDAHDPVFRGIDLNWWS